MARYKKDIGDRQIMVKDQIEDFEYQHPDVVLYKKCQAYGYFSRSGIIAISPYDGHYGLGYKIESPCWNSSRYHTVRYYIYK